MNKQRLSSSLSLIGEPGTKRKLSLRNDFYVLPKSGRLSRFMDAMRSPKPSQWTKPNEGEFSNRDWTEECQGVAHDNFYWYLSSNQNGKQRVYRMSLDNKIRGHVKLAGNGSGHLGDIDYYQGVIYCAMEKPVKIVMIDTNSFDGWRVASLLGKSGGAPPQTDCPWCAVHPWNGLLYSCNFGGTTHGEKMLRAYRPNASRTQFRHVPDADIELQHGVRRIQGGVFSKNGHVLLASDHSNDIRCYSVLNGHYRGRAMIQKNDSALVAEEVEGITIWEGISYNGVQTHVHVILLDNDWPDKDDVFFKHYRVPLSENL